MGQLTGESISRRGKNENDSKGVAGSRREVANNNPRANERKKVKERKNRKGINKEKRMKTHIFNRMRSLSESTPPILPHRDHPARYSSLSSPGVDGVVAAVSSANSSSKQQSKKSDEVEAYQTRQSLNPGA